jgi:hypothetical protein
MARHAAGIARGWLGLTHGAPRREGWRRAFREMNFRARVAGNERPGVGGSRDTPERPHMYANNN